MTGDPQHPSPYPGGLLTFRVENLTERAGDILSRIDALEKELSDLRRLVQAPFFAGADATGRVRFRVGLQEDGKYGLRVWSAAGALLVDQAG